MNQKIALVTGANRGIGLETVRQLAEQGALVYLGSRSVKKGELAIKNFPTELKENIKVIELDVTSPQTIFSALEEIQKSSPRLDLLINNAGINYDTWQSVQTADIDGTCKETFETNFFGPWRMVQAFLPLLKKSPDARIVNVSSGAGSLTSMGAGTPAYATSKAALNALTRILAAELKDAHIRVNAACPGWVATELGGEGGRAIELGARSVLLASEVQQTSGFFRDGHPIDW